MLCGPVFISTYNANEQMQETQMEMKSLAPLSLNLPAKQQ